MILAFLNKLCHKSTNEQILQNANIPLSYTYILVRTEEHVRGVRSRDMRKDVFGVTANSKDPDQPTEIYSLITNFAILRYVLQNLMSL